MTIRRVSVNISHDFELDIPDDLLEDGNEDALDDYIYSSFEDEPFDDLLITDLKGKAL